MSSSFWDQLETTIRGVDVEPNNVEVLGFKFLLWSTSVICLALSFRHSATFYVPRSGPPV